MATVILQNSVCQSHVTLKTDIRRLASLKCLCHVLYTLFQMLGHIGTSSMVKTLGKKKWLPCILASMFRSPALLHPCVKHVPLSSAVIFNQRIPTGAGFRGR